MLSEKLEFCLQAPDINWWIWRTLTDAGFWETRILLIQHWKQWSSWNFVSEKYLFCTTLSQSYCRIWHAQRFRSSSVFNLSDTSTCFTTIKLFQLRQSSLQLLSQWADGLMSININISSKCRNAFLWTCPRTDQRLNSVCSKSIPNLETNWLRPEL